MSDADDPLRRPERSLRRLQYETVDWCLSVRDIPSPRTHADLRTAQHSPEVWHDRD